MHRKNEREGLRNLELLPGINGPADILALTPGDGFDVKEYGRLKEIQSRLRAEGVEVSEGTNVARRGNVLIIVGHKDRELRAYLEALGEAGSLKGRYVLLFSCHDVGDIGFNARLIHQYGLTGIHFFGDEVNIHAVRDALFFLGDGLPRDSNQTVRVPALLRQATERALRLANQKTFNRELEKLLRGVTQISEADVPRGECNG